MALKSYTTMVQADRSINEIQASLVKHGTTGCTLRVRKRHRKNLGARIQARRAVQLDWIFASSQLATVPSGAETTANTALNVE